jgi:uncharacterized protein
LFEILVAAAAFLAGAIASVAGFGIGSILTPLLSLETGTRVAVAAVSIPHFAGTLLRFWLLRGRIDRLVLIQFGLVSAAGGLTGALLHSVVSNPALTLVFAVLLVIAGTTALTGVSRRMRFGHRAAWAAGALSGLLGGLVGNQGGIRSAALLGFGMQKHAFIATATAVGLIVDVARMPVYFATQGAEIVPAGRLVFIASVGVISGTLIGSRVLRGLPEDLFQRLIGLPLVCLGCWMFYLAL